jgi:urocanate hydratase
MNKIFITAIIRKDGNVHGLAIAENGHILAEVLSSTTYWALHDLGMDSTKNHDVYENYYPKGYKIEVVDNFEKHEGIRQAFQRVFKQFLSSHTAAALLPASL